LRRLRFLRRFYLSIHAQRQVERAHHEPQNMISKNRLTAKTSRKRPGRPRRSTMETTGNSREVLLDATARLLNERNTIDLSLSELAAYSGLNSALVKYYFGNKEGLMLALLERDAAKSAHELEHLLAMDISPAEKLRMHIAAVINTFYRSPYLNRLLHAMLDERNSESDSAKQITNFFVKPFAKLQRQLLEQGIKAKAFRKIDPTFFYVSVLGACDLLFNARTTLRTVFGVPRITDSVRERYIDHVTALVLEGITAR
jgi:AcrR family transcriptional regulator